MCVALQHVWAGLGKAHPRALIAHHLSMESMQAEDLRLACQTAGTGIAVIAGPFSGTKCDEHGALWTSSRHWAFGMFCVCRQWTVDPRPVWADQRLTEGVKMVNSACTCWSIRSVPCFSFEPGRRYIIEDHRPAVWLVLRCGDCMHPCWKVALFFLFLAPGCMRSESCSEVKATVKRLRGVLGNCIVAVFSSQHA